MSLFEVASLLHLPKSEPLEINVDEEKEPYEEIFSSERKKRLTRFKFSARRRNTGNGSDTVEQRTKR